MTTTKGQMNVTNIQRVTYSYQNNPISFQCNGNLKVNATQMAKSFPEHKRPAFWLKLQSTNEFLSELSKVRNLTLADLVKVKYGGANPGTWFHEDVALEFARWLSPAFAIWCNDKIKEILMGNYKQVETIPDFDYTINRLRICLNFVSTELRIAEVERDFYLNNNIIPRR